MDPSELPQLRGVAPLKEYSAKLSVGQTLHPPLPVAVSWAPFLQRDQFSTHV